MIELTPDTALMLYLAMTLAVILGIWICSHYRRRTRSFLPLEKELVVCEFCLFPYLDEGGKKITRCPRCDSFNQSKRTRT
jgi:hypothetical protein